MAANLHSGYNKLRWQQWITNERTNINAQQSHSLLLIHFKMRNFHWCPICGTSTYEKWSNAIVYIIHCEEWPLPVVNAILDRSQYLICSYGLFQSIMSPSPAQSGVMSEVCTALKLIVVIPATNAVNVHCASALKGSKRTSGQQCLSYGSTTCCFSTLTSKELMHWTFHLVWMPLFKAMMTGSKFLASSKAIWL